MIIENIKKLIDYEFSQRQNTKNKYEEGYVNGRIKGYQDILNMLGEHYDPIYEMIKREKILVGGKQ